METHTAEQARQREHQMMTAQIERTHQALDRCCRPVYNDAGAIAFARMLTVQQIVAMMEASHPAAVEEMRSFASASYDIQSDGTTTNRTTEIKKWTPNPPAELSVALGDPNRGAPSGVAFAVSAHDVFLQWSKAFCREMPSVILGIVEAEPTGEVANMYRGYVRSTMMPFFRRVADTFRDYSAYVEMPPKDWLKKTFPDMGWETNANSSFIQLLYSYVLSFDRVLSEWTEGSLRSSHPGAPQPLGLVMRSIMWAQERAEAKQAELIGMTSVAVVSGGLFTRAETVKAAFENEGLET